MMCGVSIAMPNAHKTPSSRRLMMGGGGFSLQRSLFEPGKRGAAVN